jgi:hypothetical protein
MPAFGLLGIDFLDMDALPGQSQPGGWKPFHHWTTILKIIIRFSNTKKL